jgi:hypothetical protein
MWVHVHLAVLKNMGSTYIEIDWPLPRRAQKIETEIGKVTFCRTAL